MKRLFALLVAAILALPAQAQTVVRPGGSIFDQSSGSFVGFLNMNNGREERLTATLGSGLSASAVICTDASKAFTSTCTSATPSFAATTVTTLNGNTFTTGSSTYTGTAGQTYTFPTTTATIARTDAANTFTGTQTIGALVATTVNGNTITTGSSTYTGTAAQTYTFPTTSATIARTDASNTFTNAQTVTCASGGCAGYNTLIFNGTTTGGSRVTGSNTSGNFSAGVEDTTGGGMFGSTTASAAVFGTSVNKPVELASNNSVQARITTNGLQLATTAANQFRTTQAAVPTVTTNGGTSPSCVGSDTAMICTIGTAPPAAATFTVTFSGTWGVAPSCQALRGTAGATPLVQNAVTATTTVQVNLSANLVASEKYHIHCIGVS